MEMVGHQTESVDSHPVPLTTLLENGKKKSVILMPAENWLFFISPGKDVIESIGKFNP
jgi:hypothetical protein